MPTGAAKMGRGVLALKTFCRSMLIDPYWVQAQSYEFDRILKSHAHNRCGGGDIAVIVQMRKWRPRGK